MFFQFIFFNVFVALTLIYLRKSTAATAKKEKEEKIKGDRLIEMLIKRDIAQAKAAEKKTWTYNNYFSQLSINSY